MTPGTVKRERGRRFVGRRVRGTTPRTVAWCGLTSSTRRSPPSRLLRPGGLSPRHRGEGRPPLPRYSQHRECSCRLCTRSPDHSARSGSMRILSPQTQPDPTRRLHHRVVCVVYRGGGVSPVHDRTRGAKTNATEPIATPSPTEEAQAPSATTTTNVTQAMGARESGKKARSTATAAA